MSKCKDTFRGGRKGSTFQCDVCSRLTRATNLGNESICPECFLACEEENAISDGVYANDPAGLAQCEARIEALRKEAVAKGGSPTRLGLAAA